jgi:ssDNA-binding Zn-finger/Zn-ribbon topoisomerase 1
MECLRCKNRDFDLVIPSLLGLPYVECAKCKQGYVVLDKLRLRYAELLGDIKDNADNSIMCSCRKCEALRFIDPAKEDLVKSVQICNRCIADVPNDGSVVTAGEKMTWEQFLNSNKLV